VKQHIKTALTLIIGTALGILIERERRPPPPKGNLNAWPTAESRSPSEGTDPRFDVDPGLR
jgi:hypothetical protein